jgi:NAD-dependent SIR2 family protein deacetylase
MQVRSLPDFLRSYALRKGQLMWLLGAGASAAAGIPTADQLVWRFKQELYLSLEGRAAGTVEDLASPKVQDFLQAYFDASGKHPRRWSLDEYSHYFELCYPSEADRRAFIDTHVKKARPSFGHAALAALVEQKIIGIFWTTNFDRTIEDAVARRLGTTSALRVATTESAHVAAQAISELTLPLLVKLHGDFHSRSLKNTSEELQQQDASLRRTFLDEIRRKGLAVVGYSGRDDSILEILEKAAAEEGAYPGGLFWFHRADSEPIDRVRRLIDMINERSGEAAAIPIGAFDELLGDVARHLNTDVPDADVARRRLSKAPIPGSTGGYPALRFNALPILRWPQTARLVDCAIGGSRDVRAAVAAANVDILAVRTKGGVVGFGSDASFEQAFASFGIVRRDVHALPAGRLHSDSIENGLLADALGTALARTRLLSFERKSWRKFLAPGNADNPIFAPLRKLVGELKGKIPKTELGWREAIQLRVEQRLDHLWLVFEPTILADDTEEETLRWPRSAFVRARLAERYNQRANDLIATWAGILTGGSTSAVVSAFGVDDGVDATFELGQTTAFSWRSEK